MVHSLLKREQKKELFMKKNKDVFSGMDCCRGISDACFIGTI